MNPARFCHLHLYSSYSFLESTCKPSGTAMALREAGHRHVGITDRVVLDGTTHGALHGAPRLDAILRENGIHPVLGSEIILDHPAIRAPLILLVETLDGFFNLSALISRHYESGRKAVPMDELMQSRYGLIGLSGGTYGGVSRLCEAGQTADALSLACDLGNLFGTDRFYLEIQDHGLPSEPLVNQHIQAISKQAGIPLVATRSVHYLTQADHPVLDLVNPSGPETAGATRNERMSLDATPGPEVQFANLPEAVEASLRIAARCDVKLQGCLRDSAPIVPLPGKTFHSNGEFLLHTALQNLKQKYGNAESPLFERARKRLLQDTLAAQTSGCVDLFLIVQDIVEWAARQGIATGPGSTCTGFGSMLSYLLGITAIDPVRFNLDSDPLPCSGPDSPRFNLDFCSERHAEVVGYIRSRYGANYVGKVITFRGFTCRGLIRDLGSRMGCTDTELRRLLAALPGNARNLDEAYEASAEFRAVCASIPQGELLVGKARRLDELPLRTGIHPCAFVLSRHPLGLRVPVRSDPESGWPVVQYEKQDLRYLGMTVIDILRSPHLTKVNRVLRKIGMDGFKAPDMGNLPENDPATFDLLRNGDISDIHGLSAGSNPQQQIRQTLPSNIDDLVKVFVPEDANGRIIRISLVLQAHRSAYLKAHFPEQWAVYGKKTP